MRLSCLPVSFFPDIVAGRLSVADWARMGSELGLDAIDLSILFLPDRSSKTAALIRRQIEDAGTRVAMLTTYPDFTHPDPAQRARELGLEVDAVGLAAELGADLIRVTAGQAHPGTARPDGIAWAVDGLARLAQHTQGSPARPVYENHAKPGAWEFTDFSQPPDIFLEIVRKTADVKLGVNFDTGNATAFVEDPLCLLEQVIARVVSVHVADTSARGELKPVLLGSGLAPLERIFRRLQRAGWDGWLCMEEASFQGRQGVAAAEQAVRRAWAEALAPAVSNEPEITAGA
jgi:sugar phosphate isomerase/epimerase